jgi:hypothetical protein
LNLLIGNLKTIFHFCERKYFRWKSILRFYYILFFSYEHNIIIEQFKKGLWTLTSKLLSFEFRIQTVILFLFVYFVLNKIAFVKICQIICKALNIKYWKCDYIQQNIHKKTKLQLVMRNSKINNFEIKVHTPFLNRCIIKLCSYEKNKMW